MKELFLNYTIEQLIILIIALLFAIKEAVTFFEWAKSHTEKWVKKNNITNQLQEEIDKEKQSIEELSKIQKNTELEIQKMNNMIHTLIESDKDDIKAWITERHHYFYYEKKFIDDYSLDCIEKRYSHYQEEGGNSFIKDLMKDIRSLPKVVRDAKNINANKKEK